MKRKVLIIFILLILFSISFVNIYADISANWPAEGAAIDNVNSGAQKIWKTVIDIVQMVAFGAVIFAGARYMLASADQKADIKKGLAALALGAILVFAASTVVDFVTKAGKQVMGVSTSTDAQ